MKYLDVRNTKKQDNRDDAIFPAAESSDNKLRMIYGVETMPAGSEYYWRSFCNTDNPRIKMAFYGMIGLLTKHNMLGGMNGKGYGRVKFELENFDAEKAIQEFDQDMLAHKEACLEGIQLLAKEFRYKISEKTEKKGKK